MTFPLLPSTLAQLSLMRDLRQSILEKRFPEFVQLFMEQRFPSGNYDPWIVDALASVNLHLKPPPAAS